MSRHRHGSQGRRVWPLVAVMVVAVLVVLVGAAVQLTRAIPASTTTTAVPATLRTVPDPAGGPIPWPTVGAAGMTVPGVVTFPTVGNQGPLPIASITKVVTTLTLLQDHPLALGQPGPVITITAPEVAMYNADVANHDSVVPITLGEQLTEYQAIEAMLVPSADDVAEAVAIWDAGNVPAFVAKMNALVKTWGMTSTHFTDVSGVDPGSVSSVADLLALGPRAMADPVIRSVVAMPTVTLPGSPKPLPTFDFALFEDGIIGIKTGSVGALNGCFLFAAQVKVAGAPKLAYGVVLGQQSNTSSIDKALHESVGILLALHRVLGGVTLLRTGQQVGELHAPWGPVIPVSTTGGFSGIAPPGAHPTVNIDLTPLAPGTALPRGATVGHLVIQMGALHKTVGIVTDAALAAPSLSWKLFR